MIHNRRASWKAQRNGVGRYIQDELLATGEQREVRSRRLVMTGLSCGRYAYSTATTHQ